MTADFPQWWCAFHNCIAATLQVQQSSPWCKLKKLNLCRETYAIITIHNLFIVHVSYFSPTAVDPRRLTIVRNTMKLKNILKQFKFLNLTIKQFNNKTY